jgi:hypothetical protein
MKQKRVTKGEKKLAINMMKEFLALIETTSKEEIKIHYTQLLGAK